MDAKIITFQDIAKLNIIIGVKMKRYRVKNKENFITTVVLVVVLILIGMYVVLHNQVDTYGAEEVKAKIMSNKIATDSAVEIQSEIEPFKNIIYDIPLSEELQQYTYEQCERWNIAETLVFALFMKESSFQIKADSGVCYGLGQLSKNTFKNSAYALEIKNGDIFNPKNNIACTVYHLSVLRDSYLTRGYSEEEVFYCMLGAYNNGSIIYDKYIKTHGTVETDYANDILDYKMQLEQYNTIIN